MALVFSEVLEDDADLQRGLDSRRCFWRHLALPSTSLRCVQRGGAALGRALKVPGKAALASSVPSEAAPPPKMSRGAALSLAALVSSALREVALPSAGYRKAALTFSKALGYGAGQRWPSVCVGTWRRPALSSEKPWGAEAALAGPGGAALAFSVLKEAALSSALL